MNYWFILIFFFMVCFWTSIIMFAYLFRNEPTDNAQAALVFIGSLSIAITFTSLLGAILL